MNAQNCPCSIQTKLDNRRYERVIKSKAQSIQYLIHAHKQASKLEGPASDAANTIQQALEEMVWA